MHRTILPDLGMRPASVTSRRFSRWRYARGHHGSAQHARRSLTAMKTGDIVADFELPDQTGTPRKLSALLSDGPVVLFFYPAAMTPGCTKEACHFRDLA